MSINKAFAVSIEANRKKQGNAKGSSFYEAERFSNRYPKRNAIMKILWGVSFSNVALFFGRGGITIGNDVFIGPKVNLITINHDPNPENRSATYGRPIVIEDKAWIGINSTSSSGSAHRLRCDVGAGSVVTKDVPPMTVVAGNPARFIKGIEAR